MITMYGRFFIVSLFLYQKIVLRSVNHAALAKVKEGCAAGILSAPNRFVRKLMKEVLCGVKKPTFLLLDSFSAGENSRN